MDHNKNVVVFTLVTTFIMLLYSVVATVFDFHPLSLNNINILSEVVKIPKAVDTSRSSVPVMALINEMQDTTPIITEQKDSIRIAPPQRTFIKYNTPKQITSFLNDTGMPSLPTVMYKLYRLKQTKTGKVRIAWLGDSMIEGDLLTQTVRKLMQQYFGGIGVGFVPATSLAASFRSTVKHSWTGDWKEENFKTDSCKAPLYFSGHTYYTNDGEIVMKDMTSRDTTDQLEKTLICGKVDEDVSVIVNGHEERFHTYNSINRLLLDNNESHSIDIAIKNDKLPVYGISFEAKNGIVLDNYSFRGISGLELGKFDTTVLNSIDTEGIYDLVVLEYGANILYKPNDTDYSWYEKHIMQVVKKLHHLMPHSEFLIISSADRAFRYGDSWQSAIGINNLIRAQAALAYVNNAAFYNMYESMGGAGTIVNWAEGTPQLANKDYIHPNQRGAEKLGSMFFEAFMKDYYKATKKLSVLN